jgi:hypothetical protein
MKPLEMVMFALPLLRSAYHAQKSLALFSGLFILGPCNGYLACPFFEKGKNLKIKARQ